MNTEHAEIFAASVKQAKELFLDAIARGIRAEVKDEIPKLLAGIEAFQDQDWKAEAERFVDNNGGLDDVIYDDVRQWVTEMIEDFISKTLSESLSKNKKFPSKNIEDKKRRKGEPAPVAGATGTPIRWDDLWITPLGPGGISGKIWNVQSVGILDGFTVKLRDDSRLPKFACHCPEFGGLGYCEHTNAVRGLFETNKIVVAPFDAPTTVDAAECAAASGEMGEAARAAVPNERPGPTVEQAAQVFEPFQIPELKTGPKAEAAVPPACEAGRARTPARIREQAQALTTNHKRRIQWGELTIERNGKAYVVTETGKGRGMSKDEEFDFGVMVLEKGPVCDCQEFRFQGQCRHAKAVGQMLEAANDEGFVGQIGFDKPPES
jgi:hypothetical protein